MATEIYNNVHLQVCNPLTAWIPSTSTMSLPIFLHKRHPSSLMDCWSFYLNLHFTKYLWYWWHLPAATLDIILSFSAWRSLKPTQIIRYLLKFIVAAFWVVILPVCYARSVPNPTGLVRFFSTLGGTWREQSLYSYLVAIYLIPNILATLLFLLPPIRRHMERSNWRIVTLLMWWAQARSFTCH